MIQPCVMLGSPSDAADFRDEYSSSASSVGDNEDLFARLGDPEASSGLNLPSTYYAEAGMDGGANSEFHASVSAGLLSEEIDLGEGADGVENAFNYSRNALANYLVRTRQILPREVGALRCSFNITQKTGVWWLEPIGVTGKGGDLNLRHDDGSCPELKDIRETLDATIPHLGCAAPVGLSGLREYRIGHIGAMDHPNAFRLLDRDEETRKKLPRDFEGFANEHLLQAMGSSSSPQRVKRALQEMAAAQIIQKRMSKRIGELETALKAEMQAKKQALEGLRQAQRAGNDNDRRVQILALERSIEEINENLSELGGLKDEIGNADLFPVFYRSAAGQDLTGSEKENANELAKRMQSYMSHDLGIGVEKKWFGSDIDHGLPEHVKQYAVASGALMINPDNPARVNSFFSENHTGGVDTGLEHSFFTYNSLALRQARERVSTSQSGFDIPDPYYMSIFGKLSTDICRVDPSKPNINIRKELAGAMKEAQQEAVVVMNQIERYAANTRTHYEVLIGRAVQAVNDSHSGRGAAAAAVGSGGGAAAAAASGRGGRGGGGLGSQPPPLYPQAGMQRQSSSPRYATTGGARAAASSGGQSPYSSRWDDDVSARGPGVNSNQSGAASAAAAVARGGSPPNNHARVQDESSPIYQGQVMHQTSSSSSFSDGGRAAAGFRGRRPNSPDDQELTPIMRFPAANPGGQSPYSSKQEDDASPGGGGGNQRGAASAAAGGIVGVAPRHMTAASHLRLLDDIARF